MVAEYISHITCVEWASLVGFFYITEGK